MKSSTFSRYKRSLVVLATVVVWQFIAVPLAFFLYNQASSIYYHERMEFHEWDLYTTGQPALMIFTFQVLGLLPFILVALVIIPIGWITSYIRFSLADRHYPRCTDINCPCAAHKDEVFIRMYYPVSADGEPVPSEPPVTNVVKRMDHTS